jgi:hypothetical protein
VVFGCGIAISGTTDHSLVNRRSDPVVVFAVHNNFRDLESSKVRQTKLDEFTGLVKFVQLGESLLERHTPVGSVQIEDVDAVRAELLERLIELLLDLCGSVSTRRERVPLSGTGQTTLLPSRLSSEGLLFAADIDSGGVDFVVSSTLESVEDLLVFVKVGDFRTFRQIGTERVVSIGSLTVPSDASPPVLVVQFLISPKGHGPENDTRLAGTSDERHFGR